MSSTATMVVPAVRSGSLYDVDAEEIASRARACRSVTDLSVGPFGAAATYLPGRVVHGVRVTADTVAVHVVMAPEVTVPQVAADLRAALTGRVGGRRVDVIVEDVGDPRPGS